MRYLLLFTIILTSFISFSQTGTYKVSELSVVSPNRDTLWLINNSTGLLIARSWEVNYYPNNEKKPVIIMADVLPNPNLNLSSNEKKSRRRRYIKGK